MSKINERILLILAILSILIIIPCSFASDVDDNSTFGDSIVADENSIYVSLDGNDTTGTGTEMSPYQSISKAVESFDSSTNSNIFIKNGTYVFDGGITIDKNVIIVGQSNTGVILDGNHTSTIFTIDSSRVQLNSLSIINGYSEGGYSSGSAVHVSYATNFIVDNCIFENNDGGALSSNAGNMEWYPANIQVRNSRFINNSKTGFGGNGAAISIGAIYSSLNVSNCLFAGNTVSNNGGAIAISSIRKESSISDSTFIANSATSGSAIYMNNGYSLNISNNNFEDNVASDEGAVVDLEAYVYGSVLKVNLKNNTFSNNAPDKEIAADGLEIVYLDKNVRITGTDIETMNVGSDVDFTVTLTDADGAGIAGKAVTVTFTDYFNRVNSYNAVTGADGKAVISLVNQTAGTYTVTSSFAGDSQYDAVNSTSSVKIKAEHSYNIVFNESIVKIKAGTSHNVTAYVCSEYITLVPYVFTNYDITWQTPSGGVRTTTNGQISHGQFTVDVLEFDLTTRQDYYYINFTARADSTTATATGTLIVDTSIPLPPVDRNIEVIYVAKDGSDEYGDGTENNPLATVQVALYVNEVFGGNKTVYVKEGTYGISNYEIYANVNIIGEKSKTIFRQAAGDDGMLYLDNGATTRFTNITFINGYMAEYSIYGAVIVVRYAGSIAYFDGCEFYENRGSSDGVIRVADNGVAYFDNCRFENNYAWTFNAAGAIEVLDAYLSVTNSYFANNTAAEGAGIFVGGDSYAWIENTVFYQNRALNDSYAISGGGAIYVNNYNTHITNCSFIENYAEINGGAIYILTGKVEIDRCIFENNHVEPGSGKGSAIASDSGYTVLLYVDHSIFISDDYSRMIAIVNDLAEENEIIINDNYWGTSSQSGTKSHVVLQVTADSSDVREGDAVEITVEFRDNSGNALTKSMPDFTLDLITQLGSVDADSIRIVDNIAKFTYYATAVGNENIIFSHNQTLYTFKFYVNESVTPKKDLNANISINDDKSQIIVEVPGDFDSNVTIKVDGETYSVKANNGVAKLDIAVLPGKHTVKVMFNGDENYKAFISDAFNFTTEKYGVNLKISVDNAVEGEDILVNITANDNFNADVNVIINGKTYTVAVTGGSGVLVIDSLTNGQYSAEAVFEGNDYFESDMANTTFNVAQSTVMFIYVSSNGSDTNNGSELAPYATLSKALDRNRRLGGNRTIIVSEGNYILNRYSIINDVTIIGRGNVVISQNANTNHIYIGGNVNVVLNGLTFIDGTGVLAGSIDTGSDDAGNIGKTLTITNCKFINNKGIVGAITTYADTTISQSTFINNTATGINGYNQAIISIQDNTVNIKNSIFLNNNYVNEVIVSRVSGNVNDNFWGDNNKPQDVGEKLTLNSWVCVVPEIDSDIRAKTNYDLTVKFQKTSDGVNFADLDNAMPDLTVEAYANTGAINSSNVLISNNTGSTNYIINQKGSDKISIDLYGKTIASLEFAVDVPEADKIYVAPAGNDSNAGTKDAPLKTIGEALVQNKAQGGNKTIILSGEFSEQNLIIDAVVCILGENATINGGAGNIFTISADAEIAYITFTGASEAIKQLSGNVYIYESEFENNTDAIVSNGDLTIENVKFIKNTDAVVSDGAVIVSESEFIENVGSAISILNNATITNSNFKDNGVAIALAGSKAAISNNVFEENIVAVDALNSDVYVSNNTFTSETIKFTNSSADLADNANVVIKLVNSTATNIVVEFMEGETIIVSNGTVQLNATVKDNMGNIVEGGKITFTSNGNVIGTADVLNGVATLEYPFTKGNYVISGSFDSADASITDGLVRVDVDYYWFIGEVGYESLEDAIAAADLGDVIKGISGTYTVGKLQIGHRYYSLEPWEVIKSVTITSIDDTPVTLKGSGVQMFFVDIGSELTLKNLIIKDAGSSSDDGGAVGTLYNTNLTIINCTFTNNKGGDGGAVYAFGNTNLEIRDTVFDSNTGLMAGALQIVAYGSQDITLKNITFSNNNAHYAGAFYNGGATFEISDSRFINNTATVGGAMFTNAGSVTVVDSEFIQNRALSDDDVSSTAMGGAFHNMLADATFRNVKFTDNYADGLGGAMELENGLYGTVTWTVLEDCSFTNNSAREGGAIYLGDIYDPYVRITSCVFDSNTADNNGAAISDNFGHVTITSSNFTNNKAGGLDIIHVAGDIVESTVYAGQLTILDSEFTNNDADYVIFTNNYGEVSITGVKFDTQKMTLYNRGEANIKNTVISNSSDYAIENLGKLSLSTNDFDTPILNKKEISSLVYVVVLSNQTISAAAGENYILKAVLLDDNENTIESGNVVFVVGQTQITSTYKDGEFRADYTVKEGSQIIDAICDDDGLTQIKVKTATIIGKMPSGLSVLVNNISVGDVATVTVNVNSQATGNVVVTVNNKNYTALISRGTARIDISDLKAGEYSVDVSYLGDDNYAPASKSLTLLVTKVSDYKINVDISKAGVGEDITITVSLPSDANGRASVTVDGDEYPVIINNGKTSVVVSDLAVGDHYLTVSYDGNDKYANSTFTSTFKVAKIESNITVTAQNIYLGNSTVITVSAPADAMGDVIITVDGKVYYASLSNGRASVEISDLDLGTYTVQATYYGDAQYLDSTSQTTFTVSEYKPVDVNITIPEEINPQDPNVSINLPADATGTMTVIVDGAEFASVSLVGGSASVSLLNLTAGAHVVEVKYSGDGKYPAKSALTAVIVTQKLPSVIEIDSKVTRLASDYSAGERGAVLYATLKDVNGNALANKTLQIAFNSKVYDVVTDDEGKAGIKISVSSAGTYSYVVSFTGDDKYDAASMVSSKVVITKKKTTIKASSKAFKVNAKTKKVSVTLKTVKNPYDKKTYLKNGKKLTLKVNGKTYTAKTNKKGVAVFKIKLTKKGKYTASIKFKGDKTYKAASKKIKITIK